MKMTSEDWTAVLPTRAMVKENIRFRLGDAKVPDERVEALVDLYFWLMRDYYARGMRGAQQAMISALDLRHLLGL